MWERGTKKPNNPGECTEFERHYMACKPCAEEQKDIHEAADDVRGVMENALDLLEMAGSFHGDLKPSRYALRTAAETLLRYGIDQLRTKVSEETVARQRKTICCATAEARS